MDTLRRPSTLVLRITLVTAALLLAGCGLSDDDNTLTSSGDGTTEGTGEGPTVTGEPGMRKPKSLCERVPLETVEGASRFVLDPGNASEQYDYPECTWRQRGKSVVVTVSLQPDVTAADFKEYRTDDAEDIADLGNDAYWSEDSTRVAVLTDEGELDVTIYNFDLGASTVRDGAITIARTIIETTEVPDTTTTTAPTTPEEATGLCARVSFETVKKYAGVPIEPGLPEEDTAESVETTCVFRERTEGSVIDLELFDSSSFDMDALTDHEDTDALGIPAKLSMSSQVIYAETPEGVLSIQILNFDLTPDEFRTGAVQLVQEFLDSA